MSDAKSPPSEADVCRLLGLSEAEFDAGKLAPSKSEVCRVLGLTEEEYEAELARQATTKRSGQAPDGMSQEEYEKAERAQKADGKKGLIYR